MSWLLVALIPGLLMLATVGLQRVESALGRDTVSADDVAEILDKAKGVGARHRPDADGGALRFSPCVTMQLADFDEFETSTNDQVRGLPTPSYVVPGPKTEFQQTRHPDRV